MAIMRTGYMDHEAGEGLIGQGYAVSVVEFTERDRRITVETVWCKPEGVTIELEGPAVLKATGRAITVRPLSSMPIPFPSSCPCP